MPVSFGQNVNYSKNGIPFSRTLAFSLPDVNASDLQYALKTIGLADESLNLGSVGTIGFVILHNAAVAGAIPPEPVISSITQAGTPGTGNYSYIVIAHFSDGALSVSLPVSTALGAMLNGTNYNIITWPTVTGASSYDVYRTVAAAGIPAILSSITQAGTPGTNNYSYLVVAHFPDGAASVSAILATALGNATLNGTNYNIVTWGAVTGATSYDVYRTASDGSPATLGKIATGATSPLHDTGLAGDGSTAASIPATLGKIATGSTSPLHDTGLTGDGSSTPSEIASNFEIQYGDLSADYPQHIYAGEDARFRCNSAAIHVKSIVVPTLLESWICPA